jgi:hypothetical protein
MFPSPSKKPSRLALLFSVLTVIMLLCSFLVGCRSSHKSKRMDCPTWGEGKPDPAHGKIC